MKSIIEVRNLFKKYTIGAQQKRYLSLRDQMVGGVKNLFRGRSQKAEEFYALKDLSFDVYPGDTLGIIGRNGAGKSTLLKILSRITPPTTGHITLRGRVASLLEVGTGFHPELTGRENIFLNGAILGMRRGEINRKFDEIVDFSGVEQFLDTPLKQYSSGMQLRLAFAVAAHLEPEILLIDEVLAVGDIDFQKKCLGKMEQVSRDGRTILFVSHEMGAVESLCTKSIILKNGEIDCEGPAATVISHYLSRFIKRKILWEVSEKNKHLFSNPNFSPLKLQLLGENKIPLTHKIKADERVGVLIAGKIKRLDNSLSIGVAIYNEKYQLLFWSFHTDKSPEHWIPLKVGINKFIVWVPKYFLNEGIYYIELVSGLYNREWLNKPQGGSPVITLEIEGGWSHSPYWTKKRPGDLAPVLDFELTS